MRAPRPTPPLPIALLASASLLLAAGTGAEVAEYELVFEALWDASHASEPLPGSAHFTTLIGDTHAPGWALWQEGGLASAGIENVAEIGFTAPLSDEIRGRRAAGVSGGEVRASDIRPTPGQSSTVFLVGAPWRELSLISMVAPSPDWFVGVSGLSLRDAGGWIPALSVDALPHDAGTETGDQFRLANPPSDPHEPISVRGAPFYEDAVIARFHLTFLPEPGAALSGLAGLAGLAACARRRAA